MPSTLSLALSCTALVSFAAAQNCAQTSVGFTPLDDLGAGTYQGVEGGLYPDGARSRPTAHEVAGLEQSTRVVPRNQLGVPDAGGRIVVMSLGMSNCAIHWQAFMQASNADTSRHPAVTLVQGAQGGVPAEDMDDPNDSYWTTVLPQKLQQAGVAHVEVQVLWFLQANRNPSAGFPAQTVALQSQMESILRIAKTELPNLRVVYCASRIYAGYASTALNPEPYAYEQAFAVKWMIEKQLDGDPSLNFDLEAGAVVAPWITWGPYMWADGLVPRSDGLTWNCADFNADGTHPSALGSAKNAAYLLDFFQTDPTARTWYLAEPDPVIYGVGKVSSSGSLPTIGSSGEPSLAANDFRVALSDALPLRMAILFRGPRPHDAPFVGGTLWVHQPLDRFPPRQTNASGATFYDLPIGPAMVGHTQHFQFWYRDGTHSDGTGAGLSNAMQVRFRL